jgi:hypothetical protein
MMKQDGFDDLLFGDGKPKRAVWVGPCFAALSTWELADAHRQMWEQEQKLKGMALDCADEQKGNCEGGICKMDYDKAAENLDKGGDSWKPDAGQYQVLIVGEPEACVFTDDKGKDTEQVRMPVKVGGKDLTWFVTKGLTSLSLYGQLMLVGRQKRKLSGETVNVIVAGSGKDKRYTVVEASVAKQEFDAQRPKEESVVA